MLHLAKDISGIELPSLIEQLKSQHPVRKRLDEVVLKAIDLSPNAIARLIPRLHRHLAQEVEALKSLVEGVPEDDLAE